MAPPVLVAALGLIAGLVVGTVRGQPPAPAPGVATLGPLTLTAFSPLPVSQGYRPVRVTLSTTKPAAGDRVFEIRLTGTGWFGRQESVEVTQELILPGGATSASISVLMPQLSPLSNAQIQIYDEGLEIVGLASGFGLSGYTNGLDFSGTLPTVLVVSDTDVPSGVLARTIGRQEDYRWGFNGAGQSQPPTSLVTLARQSLAELDERWLAYSGFDLVCLTLDQAERLMTLRPKVWSALLDWTAAGGNLIVSGVVPASDAPRADRLFGLRQGAAASNAAAPPAAPATGPTAATEPPVADTPSSDTPASDTPSSDDASAGPTGPWPEAWRGWQPPDPKAYSSRIEDPDWQDYYQSLDDAAQASAEAAAQALAEAAGLEESPASDEAAPADETPPTDAPAESTTEDATPDPSTRAQPTPPARPEFLWRSFGLGAVVVHGAPDLFPGTPESWGWVLNTLTPDRWLWYRRHGISNRQLNPDYWNFVLANVGRAPVFAFQVLISLFVVVIGPVNYFVCRRWRKLHLLLVTTPVCAAAVAGALFCYALASDGLSTRVRDRNLTWIDQPSGRAAAVTRMSWYAGLTPSELAYPADVMVSPLGPQGSVGVGTGRQLTRSMAWVDDQRLTRGWLPARTPTQFVTVRARQTSARLDFVVSSPDGAGGDDPGWTVTNQLGTHVERLFVVDDQGQLYRAEDLPPEGRATLVPVEANQAGSEAVAYLDRYRLAIPAGIDPSDVTGWTTFGVSYYWGQGRTADPVWADSRAEQVLREALVNPAGLPPRSYVAVVARSPEVLWGLSDPRGEADLHVVVGHW